MSILPVENKIVFVPSGRLGNAIFRYMACAVINIENPSLGYILKDDFTDNDKENFTYYPGLDHEGDDTSKTSLQDNNIMGYNTLGYFKHTVNVANLKSNVYINKENGHGIYVKKTLTLTDDNFLSFKNKKLEYFNIKMDGFFQFGHIYLQYKSQILNYMNQHKFSHYIQTDTNRRFLLRELLDDIHLLPEKHYDIVIHIRLGDFIGRPDYIELKYYLSLFQTIDWSNKRICLLFDPTTKTGDCIFIEECMHWFEERGIHISIESNSLLVDFNIMKQAKILVCSMSTLAWTAAYLSTTIQQCYMPNYNYYKTLERSAFYFRQPIENTILYPVKTTHPYLSLIKPLILTLPDYATVRLKKLDNLRQQLSQIGLETCVYNGVNGKDITVTDTANETVKEISYQGVTLTYKTTIRINGFPMTRGEFGCAWSHLNLFKQLLSEEVSVCAYYLILEDDVELVKPLNELYELFEHIPADMDLCHLAKSDWYPFKKTKPINAYFSECEKLFFNKTTAYLVSKKGAEKLLLFHQGAINVPIDDLINMSYRLIPDFRFYVPVADYFFKEQDNIDSTIHAINQLNL
jgi:GR25 family glycosyltransferase involved in LPS biosynthesis